MPMPWMEMCRLILDILENRKGVGVNFLRRNGGILSVVQNDLINYLMQSLHQMAVSVIVQMSLMVGRFNGIRRYYWAVMDRKRLSWPDSNISSTNLNMDFSRDDWTSLKDSAGLKQSFLRFGNIFQQTLTSVSNRSLFYMIGGGHKFPPSRLMPSTWTDWTSEKTWKAPWMTPSE